MRMLLRTARVVVAAASLMLGCHEDGPACANGTFADGTTCLPEAGDPSVVCGEGTVLVNGVCVLAEADAGQDVAPDPGPADVSEPDVADATDVQDAADSVDAQDTTDTAEVADDDGGAGEVDVAADDGVAEVVGPVLPPDGWACPLSWFADGETCHCGCGGPDLDCDDAALPVQGCLSGVCNPDGTCAACVPDCDGKTCGDDGCGGLCGDCNDPAFPTCVDGQCQACQPTCIDDPTTPACGDDGCGGSCGACVQGTYCIQGLCGVPAPAESCIASCGSVAPAGCSCAAGCDIAGTCCLDFAEVCGCIPDCVGKTCGDDGCGGVCGECSGDAACVEGQCQVDLCGPNPCSGNGVCNASDGSCDCQEGFAGDACETCAEGLAGYPDCESVVCFLVDCDDKDPCTTDTCVVDAGGCVNEPVDVDCVDGVACTAGAYCGEVHGQTCQDIKSRNPLAPSAVYGINPTGYDAFEVYCDMATDGGGWTKVLHYGTSFSGWGTGDIGTIAQEATDAVAKLSDERINSLYGYGEWRLQADGKPTKTFVRNLGEFDDTQLGWGFGNIKENVLTSACSSADVADCTFVPIGGALLLWYVNWLDTYLWGLTGDDEHRYFLDHEGYSPGCWGVGLYSDDPPVRCVSQGASNGNVPMDHFSLWVREAPLHITTPVNLSVTNTGTWFCADGGDMVNYSVVGLTADGATLDQPVTPPCLHPGDEVLLMNMRGAQGATANVGAWELLKIATVDGTSVTFEQARTVSMGATEGSDDTIGLGDGEQRVVLQRVPHYFGFDITASGQLTAHPWNGDKGGVFAARMGADMQLEGLIEMNGKGYAGGAVNGVAWTNGQQGESISGPGGQADNQPNTGGGGGGFGDGQCWEWGFSAGGGGHVGPGTDGSDAGCGGKAGAPYAVSDLSRVFMGSGGGAGGTDNAFSDNPPGAAGGSGGGLILLFGNKRVLGSGAIEANGAAGTGDDAPCTGTSTSDCWDYAGAGGGGAGGSIIFPEEPDFSLAMSVAGGAGGIGSSSGVAGSGGVGRVHCALGRCEGRPGASCKAIRDDSSDAGSGVYWIDPDGAGAFEVYCEMGLAGGGWTMCFTSDNSQLLSGLTANAGTYGTAGYARRCANLPFNDALYVNHDLGTWVAATQPSPDVTYEFASCVGDCTGRCGQAQWAAWELASSGGEMTSSNAGVQFCEACGFNHAVHFADQPPGVGFNACDNWAAYSGPAIRLEANAGFPGVRWVEDSHLGTTPQRLVSLGVR